MSSRESLISSEPILGDLRGDLVEAEAGLELGGDLVGDGDDAGERAGLGGRSRGRWW